MNDYEKAIASYFKGEEKLKVFAIYDGGDKYLFGVKDPKSKEEPLDPWYTIDKKTKKINGFQPNEDWSFFEKAFRHKVKKDWR